jgi:putative Ca2+/H+ antiporter (TMEM165/GDT1 family)
MEAEAFFVTTAVVAIGEIGDKTQLLSLILAARYRRPVPIILGILCATLANHAVAAAAGIWLRGSVPPGLLRWVLGLSFLAIAAWALIPDQADGELAPAARYGVFLLTLVAFFLAEMGDKTQVTTLMLAAKYDAIVTVVAGSTLGMLCADVPAVLLASAAPRAIPLKAVRFVAAALFAALGVAALVL